MMTLQNADHGIGYKHNDFADTTVHIERVRQLAKLAHIGQPDEAEYRYRKASDEGLRPCDYPESLDGFTLRMALRSCETWGEARIQMWLLACQISQTGWVFSDRRATEHEREWGHLMYAAYRADQQLRHVPGTCRGCQQTPCNCLA